MSETDDFMKHGRPSKYPCRACGAKGTEHFGGTSYECGSSIGNDAGSRLVRSDDCIVRQADLIRSERGDSIVNEVENARAEVIRYADLVASWKPGVLVSTEPASMAESELEGLRLAVNHWRSIGGTCKGAMGNDN